MPVVAIVTLIGVALTVLALAAYLTRIALILKQVNFTLGTIIAGLWSIPNQTQNMRSVMDQITGDLAEAQQALESVLARKLEPTPVKEVPVQKKRGRPRGSRVGSAR